MLAKSFKAYKFKKMISMTTNKELGLMEALQEVKSVKLDNC